MLISRWLFAIPFWAVSAVSYAADRWYEVEVLVFAHTKPDLTAEKWPVNDAGPLLNQTVMINSSLPTPAAVAAAGASQLDAAASANDALKVSLLSPAHLQLKDALKTLSRSRNYRPLLHTGWRQPIAAGKEAFKVRLAAGKDFSAEFGQNGQLLSAGAEPALPFGLWELDGYIKLTASQFLHAETNLVFRAPMYIPPTAVIGTETPATSPTTPATTPPSTDAATNLTWQTTDAPLLENQLQFYRLIQNRRIKAKELHYFDHPLYGMVIELRPMEGRVESDGEAEE